MFTAPIFYPREAAPAALQPWLVLNPLTIVVEQLRAVAIFGAQPDWRLLGLYLLAGLVTATLGHYWFERTRSAFADVL
jgi:lipopolysaccharide transport system permease protein